MKPVERKFTYKNRELCWLAFNARVLQEAADERVPLIERIKFLGIFSSNLDEFFRVRVASLKRILQVSQSIKGTEKMEEIETLLHNIQSVVVRQRRRFNQIQTKLITCLRRERIFLMTENNLTEIQKTYIKNYFYEVVVSTLCPIMLDTLKKFPTLKNDMLYLAVRLHHVKKKRKYFYALIELPTDVLPRFVEIPTENKEEYAIIRIDDIIRFNMDFLFSIFDYDKVEAYTIKVTRDAELDFDNDEQLDAPKMILKLLKKRRTGVPVRLTYDREMPKSFLEYFLKKLKLKNNDHIIAGGRYHNSKDFINFPKVGKKNLVYPPAKVLLSPYLKDAKSIFRVLNKRDIMLHYPYQNIHHFIDFLREASIDPCVQSIQMTIYRLASNSKIARTLINAVRNGKNVTVVLELRARFDEEQNANWAQIFEDEGIRVTYGFEEMKIHSKCCLIERKGEKKTVYYSAIGTGNFNEKTASLYCDDILLTSSKKIGEDVKKVFSYMVEKKEKPNVYHLLMSPFYMENKLIDLIKYETNQSKKGQSAKIIIKLNNLIENRLINELYKASNQGVKIFIIVRGICTLIPKVKGMSENIRVISIIDRFLEHSRVFYFHHNGKEKMFISSADWMKRNMRRRVEVATPIYDKNIVSELKKMLELQLEDNQKSRIINSRMDNRMVSSVSNRAIRSQMEIYYYLKNKS